VLRTLLALALLTPAPAALAQGLGGGLQQVLGGLSPDERTTVIVTFDQMGPLTLLQRTLVASTGVTKGVFFEALPMAAVLATPRQVDLLVALPGVRAVWANEELEYYNDTGTAITGVDRLRDDPNLHNAEGLPFTGRGVTVVVNDSGIDATHADLLYGPHVVENVQALTNLNALHDLLPITYVEGTPNTDLNSGHGTHVAGTVGGTGARSDGLYEGVAPGADLVGYGSGAVLFILDALGGFDYAISRQDDFRHPIRVITNSWGTSGRFDPRDPVVQASYQAFREGINVVFAAGNEGSGADTHNPYAVAPWVISVGAGDKGGLLADFSSRGVRGQTATFTMPDGTAWTARNELTVTAPGVNIVSARASTVPNGPDDLTYIPLQYLPFYTVLSGTSMATPHVAGIVALMLEANPVLDPLAVRALLAETATNMPGLEAWEAGAGYANAYAAVQAAAGQSALPFGSTVNSLATFHASAELEEEPLGDFDLFFNPLGGTEELPFEVGPDVDRISASAAVNDNFVALVLIAPDGTQYGSAISIPGLFPAIAVSAPGQPGTWVLTVRGIGSVSGVSTDPLGITQGTSLPGNVRGTLTATRVVGYTGLDDIAGHPDEAAIAYAVAQRLVDARPDGYFPDDPLRRIELAQYLTMGAAARQYFPTDGGLTFADVPAALAPYAEAAAAAGAALPDAEQDQDGLIYGLAGDAFRPQASVRRVELAYALVQALALQDLVAGWEGNLHYDAFGTRVPVADQAAVPPELRGYVQAALDLRLLDVRLEAVQLPSRPQPTLLAYVEPAALVSRADYAVAAGRFLDSYATTVVFEEEGARAAAAPAVTASAERPAAFSLDGNHPNPFGGPGRSATTIRFTLSASADVSLRVYDVTGREVARLVEGRREAGPHEVRWDAAGLASGLYLYRLQSGDAVETRRMVVLR
jgi:serine protease AprX